jgi:phage terminase Nu1 subunit (DNA packaging protein)
LGVSSSTAAQRSALRLLADVGTERYVSRVELAAIMGVSLATVDRMVAEGMPSVTWGRRTRRFRPSIVVAWAEDRGRS